MRTFSVFTALLALAVAGLSAGAARADGWIGIVTLRLRERPPFEGAANHTLSPLGAITLRRASRPYRFVPPDYAGGISLIDTGDFQAGPLLRFSLHRDSGKYTGLRRIGAAGGVFMDIWPRDWLRAHLEARRSLSANQGWEGDAGLDLIHTGDRISASIGPRLGAGDRRYMDANFGVTPTEAAMNPALGSSYAPGAGVRYVGMTTAVSWRLDGRWRTTFDLSYHRLTSVAGRSPIVNVAGSPDQIAAGVGVSYTLGRLR